MRFWTSSISMATAFFSTLDEPGDTTTADVRSSASPRHGTDSDQANKNARRTEVAMARTSFWLRIMRSFPGRLRRYLGNITNANDIVATGWDDCPGNARHRTDIPVRPTSKLFHHAGRSLAHHCKQGAESLEHGVFLLPAPGSHHTRRKIRFLNSMYKNSHSTNTTAIAHSSG